MKRALALVNKARQALGKKPLKAFPCGVPVIASACPVAQALGAAGVTGTAVRFNDAGHAARVAQVWPSEQHAHTFYVGLPETLREFVRDFDAGRYPELVAK